MDTTLIGQVASAQMEAIENDMPDDAEVIGVLTIVAITNDDHMSIRTRNNAGLHAANRVAMLTAALQSTVENAL